MGVSFIVYMNINALSSAIVGGGVIQAYIIERFLSTFYQTRRGAARAASWPDSLASLYHLQPHSVSH